MQLKFKYHNDTHKRIDVDKTKISETYLPRSKLRWLIGFDDTDHFQFFCPQCKSVAHIVNIVATNDLGNSGTLYFHLECPKCKIVGQRKIYLNESDEGARFEKIFSKSIKGVWKWWNSKGDKE